MAFEVFKRRSRPISGVPVIGLQNRGTISLNASAFELLRQRLPDGNGEMSVELLYDTENKLVGLRAVAAGSKNSYPVRKQPTSASYLITGKGFLQYHGIKTDGTRRYTARIYEDTIVGFSLLEDEIDREESKNEAVSG